MTSRNSKQGRKLSFQTLESRDLMAGNVMARMSNGSLTLTGDNNSNSVVIEQVGANQFRVEGFDNTAIISPTNTNTFHVTGNISMLFQGNQFNELRIGSSNNPNSAVSLPGSLNVALGNGGGALSTGFLSIAGNLTVQGGAGQHNIDMEYSSVGRSTFNGGKNDCNINLGGGQNFINLYYTPVERDLLVNDTGTGAVVTVEGGNVGRNATVTTGSGKDVVCFDECYLSGQLKIQTGAGNDDVFIGEPVQEATLPTDNFGFSPVHADSFYIDLGAGNDRLKMDGGGARQATLIGGTGVLDYLLSDYNNPQFNGVSISGFEVQGYPTSQGPIAPGKMHSMRLA
jgi:hypothetical protein